MKQLTKTLALTGLALGALCGPAQAMLIDAGNGLINDTDQTLVWTQDANLFKTQYDADNGIVTDIISTVNSVDGHTLVAGDFNTTDGRMTWWGAMAWADWLDYGGYNDWRLTTITDTGSPGCNFGDTGTDCGYNVDTSTGELAYMHHDILGNESWNNPDGTRNIAGCPDTDPYCVQNTSADGVDILNLQSFVYWSGTEYAPSPDNAWSFGTLNGSQGVDDRGFRVYGWAVRAGQVAAAPLPPTSLWMALGLIGLGARGYARQATLALR